MGILLIVKTTLRHGLALWYSRKEIIVIKSHFSTPRLTQFYQKIPYIAEPVTLYRQLCSDNAQTLLLESAEIESKQNLKSWIIAQSALKVVCENDAVILTALTQNGEAALAQLKSVFQQQGTLINHTQSALVLNYPKTDPNLDEESRLTQITYLDALRTIKNHFSTNDAPAESVFLAGLLSYDLVDKFEPLPTVPQTDQCPDYVFYLAETLIEIDHQTQQANLYQSHFVGNQTNLNQSIAAMAPFSISSPTPFPLFHAVINKAEITESKNDSEFNQIIKQLKKHVEQGDVFQIVPSRRFSLPCSDPLAAYLQLKKDNPSPYMFYLHDTKFTLFGASPESALKYTNVTRQIEIYPIAGTRPRGKTQDGQIDLDLDSRIELNLRQDEKENAEHMMLVDLARNDVARIAEPASRYVADLLKVDRYSHVMHLVSRVVGKLQPSLDALHAYQACMNMGTLTGAPKVRAMQLIRQFEKQKRGSYGGAVGYLNAHGDLDTCIVIRSAYVENNVAQVQAGAGVVYDSDPQSESNETRQKAQAVINAIQKSQQRLEEKS
jgi:anthranilate synthase component 1